MKTISKYAIAIITLLVASVVGATAQENRNNDIGCIQPHFDESALQRIMPTRYGGRSRKWREDAIANEEKAQQAEAICQYEDSLNLPSLNQYGQPETIGRYPLALCGWDSWSLHRGLNVQIGASVFAQFGKGAHSGAGFQQNIALMYAMPVTDRLSVAVGGYLNNINYAGGNWHNAGLSAVLGYRLNEHWEAYIYGQKSLSNNVGNRFRYSMYDGYYGGYYGPGMGGFGGFSRNFFGMPAYSVYDMSNMGDRIGATVRYNVNNNLSIEVSVENRWLPSHP